MGFWITFEKIQCWGIVFLTPCFYILQLFVVMPDLAARYSAGTMKINMHIVLSTFCFVNVAGNLMMVIFTDTSVKRGSVEGDYCEICKLKRPPDAWHCKTCDICINRRDHHCFFLSRCIGRNNQRYFLLYLLYLTISMIYALYYNFYFISHMYEGYGFLFAICRFLNPMLRMLRSGHECFATQDMITFYFLSMIGILFWSLSLFSYHIQNVMRGVTWHEAMKKREFFRDNKLSDEYWRENLLCVFGTNWYWAVVFPFARSPLHGNYKTTIKLA